MRTRLTPGLRKLFLTSELETTRVRPHLPEAFALTVKEEGLKHCYPSSHCTIHLSICCNQDGVLPGLINEACPAGHLVWP